MEELLTTPEVAKILHVSPDYVYKLYRAGQLKPVKIGRLKCRRSAVDDFIRRMEGKDATDPFNIIEWEGGE